MLFGTLQIWWWAAVKEDNRKQNKKMSSSNMPGRFDNGDFVSWLREFDTCCPANDWTTTEDCDDKILKLPAFLQGRVVSHFYAILAAQHTTYMYATAVAELKKLRKPCLCPAAENFYVEFESRTLHYLYLYILRNPSHNVGLCFRALYYCTVYTLYCI